VSLLLQTVDIVRRGKFKVEQQAAYFTTLTFGALFALLQAAFLAYVAATEWDPAKSTAQQPRQYALHAIWVLALCAAYAFTLYSVQRHRELRKDVGWARHLSIGAYALGDIFLRALTLATFVAALNKAGLLWLALLCCGALLALSWCVRCAHVRRVAPAEQDAFAAFMTVFFQFFTEVPIALTRHGIEADDVMDQLYMVVKVVVGTVAETAMLLTVLLLEGDPGRTPAGQACAPPNCPNAFYVHAAVQPHAPWAFFAGAVGFLLLFKVLCNAGRARDVRMEARYINAVRVRLQRAGGRADEVVSSSCANIFLSSRSIRQPGSLAEAAQQQLDHYQTEVDFASLVGGHHGHVEYAMDAARVTALDLPKHRADLRHAGVLEEEEDEAEDAAAVARGEAAPQLFLQAERVGVRRYGLVGWLCAFGDKGFIWLVEHGFGHCLAGLRRLVLTTVLAYAVLGAQLALCAELHREGRSGVLGLALAFLLAPAALHIANEADAVARQLRGAAPLTHPRWQLLLRLLGATLVNALQLRVAVDAFRAFMDGALSMRDGKHEPKTATATATAAVAAGEGGGSDVPRSRMFRFYSEAPRGVPRHKARFYFDCAFPHTSDTLLDSLLLSAMGQLPQLVLVGFHIVRTWGSGGSGSGGGGGGGGGDSVSATAWAALALLLVATTHTLATFTMKRMQQLRSQDLGWAQVLGVQLYVGADVALRTLLWAALFGSLALHGRGHQQWRVGLFALLMMLLAVALARATQWRQTGHAPGWRGLVQFALTCLLGLFTEMPVHFGTVRVRDRHLRWGALVPRRLMALAASGTEVPHGAAARFSAWRPLADAGVVAEAEGIELVSVARRSGNGGGDADEADPRQQQQNPLLAGADADGADVDDEAALAAASVATSAEAELAAAASAAASAEAERQAEEEEERLEDDAGGTAAGTAIAAPATAAAVAASASVRRQRLRSMAQDWDLATDWSFLPRADSSRRAQPFLVAKFAVGAAFQLPLILAVGAVSGGGPFAYGGGSGGSGAAAGFVLVMLGLLLLKAALLVRPTKDWHLGWLPLMGRQSIGAVLAEGRAFATGTAKLLLGVAASYAALYAQCLAAEALHLQVRPLAVY
jgi:hypothetical protein